MEQLDYLIDRKISGLITATEAKQLDQMILNKPELSREIESRLDISKAVQYAGNEELRKSLKLIHKEEFSQQKISKLISLKTILSVAAIFVLGIGGYMFLMTSQINDLSGEQIYTSYYKPFKASFQSRNETTNFDYTEFKTAYSNDNYKVALSFVKEENNLENINDNEVLLTMGISALEMGDTELAKTYFQEVLERDDYFFSDHAKWYIALSYMKDENIAKAIPYLKELSSDKKADHNIEALELLAEIE